MMLRAGRRCACWCRCRYHAARHWQSGMCVPCIAGAHEPKPDAPDHGANGPRIVQARRYGAGPW